jgi:prepilin-type processing-associated H-X9-DG protein
MDELVKHLEPAGAMSWSDESGFHWKSTTPFPGAELVNGPTVLALAAPAVLGGAIAGISERNRITGPQQMCAAHQRNLGQAIAFYANAHDGNYPPDLGALVENLDSPIVFICPNATKEIPETWQGMTVEQRSEWVNANASYVYLGAGLTTQTATPTTIVLHDRENRHQGQGMNMLYGDGSVKFLPVRDAKRALRQQRQGK